MDLRLNMIVNRTALVPPTPPLSAWTAAYCFAASSNCLDTSLLAAILHPKIAYVSEWGHLYRRQGSERVIEHFRAFYTPQILRCTWPYRSQVVTCKGSAQTSAVHVRPVDPDYCDALVRLSMCDGLVVYIHVTPYRPTPKLILTGVYPPDL